MAPNMQVIRCNGFAPGPTDVAHFAVPSSELRSRGANANVQISFEHIAKNTKLSGRMIDLLEIAAFVYCADSQTARGTALARASRGTLESWERGFMLGVPVHDIDFWLRPDVDSKLQELLHFLSDDRFRFAFAKSTLPLPITEYLEFEEEPWPFSNVDRVVMFSGGLDSLAGAVQTLTAGSELVLVSHRSAAQVDKRTQVLFNKLATKAGSRLIRVPVMVNKSGTQEEYNPRTRSFLFAALGFIIAESLQAAGIRFFENGVVSLNLPIADEVLRSRASRTTHPRSLRLLSELLSMVAERPLIVDNPFLTMSKRDVVSLVKSLGMGDLIALTCSCAHVRWRTASQQHCGQCSQCIDRRIATIAAGCEELDPDIDYTSDVFTGERKSGYPKSMAVDFARHALELSRMSEAEFSTRFASELARATYGASSRSNLSQQLTRMHLEHGQAVKTVLTSKLATHAAELFEGTLPDSCMLRLVADGVHQTESWTRYAGRISELLKEGVPIAAQTKRPENELRLQELCEAILTGHGFNLEREFPFMRWSLSSTKPDFSSAELRLWVEVKYVRQKSDIKPIIRAIAEDITKYADNSRFVLFWIYDPDKHILDEKSFSKPILDHGMMISTAR